MKPVKWENNQLILIDQTKLPGDYVELEFTNYREVANAIKTMIVRGAPAIGVAAAYGLALAAIEFKGLSKKEMIENLDKASEILAETRPTAVNLFWAIDRMGRVWRKNEASPEELANALVLEAKAIDTEDVIMNKNMGNHGNSLIPVNATILTHCNAGALATAGYGTALGVIRAAHEAGKNIQVYADETRPLLQGARLTAWELHQDNIPVTLITDSMAGYLMKQGKIDLIIVGADRITANGDVANKIGTYSLAVLAKAHNVPFYVAAPTSTVDLNLQHGDQIPIEERHHDEVKLLKDYQLAPKDIKVYNPAFDVTPSQLITAIITDQGIANYPYENVLEQMVNGEKHVL